MFIQPLLRNLVLKYWTHEPAEESGRKRGKDEERGRGLQHGDSVADGDGGSGGAVVEADEEESEAGGRGVAGGVFAEGVDVGIRGGAAVGRQRALGLCGVGARRWSDVSSAGEGDGETVSAGI